MFNLKNFKKIKKIHFKILNQKKLVPQIVANQYLFLTRFHPQLVNQYLNEKNYNQINKFKVFLPFFISYIKNFFSKNNFVTKKKLKHYEVVFISTIDQKMFLNKENQHLKEIIELFEGKDYLEIIKSHFSIDLEKNINFQNKHNKKRIFLKNNIGFFKEIKMLLSLYLNFRNQKKFFINKNYENNNVIKKIFSKKAFFSSINNYRFFIQLKLLLKIIKPKIIFFPYEGLPWERLITCAAKINNINIRCIGYQKSVITKYSDLMKTNLKNNLYNPDKIICRSKIDRKKLLANGSLSKNQIIVGGKYKKNKLKSKKFKKIKVLVLPEAWSSEEKKLLDFTLSCAKLFPNFNFIFRPHPISMFNFGKSKLKDLKNLQISNTSFDKDISNCNLVFFRGSYSVIKACKNGLFPVYIKFPSDFDTDINPLYEIENKIIKLSDPKKFNKIINYVQASKSCKKKLYITNHCNKINLKLEKKYIKYPIINYLN